MSDICCGDDFLMMAVEVKSEWQYAAKITRIGSFDKVELSLEPPKEIELPENFEVSDCQNGKWELISSKPISNSIYCIYSSWRRRVTMKFKEESNA